MSRKTLPVLCAALLALPLLTGCAGWDYNVQGQKVWPPNPPGPPPIPLDPPPDRTIPEDSDSDGTIYYSETLTSSDMEWWNSLTSSEQAQWEDWWNSW